jgi:hypothetical protein
MEWSDDQLFVLSKNANIKVYSGELELIEILKMPEMSICSQLSNSNGLVLGFSGHECILYDTKSEMELVRTDTKGGARPITYSSEILAWAQTDQLFV